MQKPLSKNSLNNVVVALDVGTTRIKAIAFDTHDQVVAQVSAPLKKSFPQPHHVEQNPKEMVSTTHRLLKKLNVKLSGKHVTAFGIANQRETVIAWHPKTSKPLSPALVWQDERTKKTCQKLARQFGHIIEQKTGLPLTPYFSATKMRVLQEEYGPTCVVGTVDTWLLWNLDASHPFLTDESNASRTLLFNIHTRRWDQQLLDIFGISSHILPRILPSQSQFGTLDSSIFGYTVPIRAVCGDQQASAVASGLNRGATKVTFGTGTFIMQRLGSHSKRVRGWYTTLVPGKKGSDFALESKLPFYSTQVDAVLNNSMKRRMLYKRIAATLKRKLASLPIPVYSLTVDGGVSQSEELITELKRVLKIQVKRHNTPEGTALGIAKLLQ